MTRYQLYLDSIQEMQSHKIRAALTGKHKTTEADWIKKWKGEHRWTKKH